MSQPTIRVAIAGATSRMARLITKYLLEHPHIHIHGLCRDPSKLPEATKSHPRFKSYKFEAFDAPSIREGVSKCQTVICCYSPAAPLLLEGQKLLIDASIAEGVTRYFAGDFTWDFRHIPVGLVPPKDFTIEIAGYLEERRNKIKAVHILTGAFMDNILAYPFLLYWDQGKVDLKSWGTGEEVFEMSTYDDTAKWTAQAVLDDSAEGYLAFISDTLTTKEIAATLSSVYNRQFPLILQGSLSEFKTTWQNQIATEPNNVRAWLINMLQYNVLIGTGRMSTPLDNARYPKVKGTTLRNWLSTRKLEDLPTANLF